MHPDLVGTSCPRLRHDQAGDVAGLDGNEFRHRRFTPGMHAHEAFARAALLAQQRCVATPAP